MAKRRYTVGKGVDKYLAQLETLEINSRTICGEAIEKGAGEVVGAVRKEIEALPIQQGKFGSASEPLTGITSVQKQGLIDGLGITPQQDEGGTMNRKIGFAGYNRTRTDKHPQGQPNAVIARSLVSGTSFREKNDFIGRAVRKSKAKAEEAMKQAIDKGIAETINKGA